MRRGRWNSFAFTPPQALTWSKKSTILAEIEYEQTQKFTR